MSEMPDFKRIVRQMVAEDFRFEAEIAAGRVAPAEIKAHEARRAEQIADLDARRGTADVTYADFRAAFEQGVGCEVLIALKNLMDPKDPLRDAAIEDLRSVECYSRQSIRRRDHGASR